LGFESADCLPGFFEGFPVGASSLGQQTWADFFLVTAAQLDLLPIGQLRFTAEELPVGIFPPPTRR